MIEIEHYLHLEIGLVANFILPLLFIPITECVSNPLNKKRNI